MKTDPAKIKPLQDRVLVKKDEEPSVSKGGVALPDQSKGRPKTGVVLAVGPGKWSEHGAYLIPVGVKEGQRVLLAGYGVCPDPDDKMLALFDEKDLLAVAEGAT